MYLLDGNGNVVADPAAAATRRADAALFGWARLGSLLCPVQMMVTNKRKDTCSVTADGLDNISLWTGKGDVEGTFAVVVQDDNAADAPEFVVMNGSFSGDMDLSTRPLGNVAGTFTATGGQPVAFCGTVRLPFAVSATGRKVNPTRTAPAYYLADDGATLLYIGPREKSLGMPTVRFEINLGSRCN
jgi:hypothetical protein